MRRRLGMVVALVLLGASLSGCVIEPWDMGYGGGHHHHHHDDYGRGGGYRHGGRY
ncbi:hypothetical protein LPW11_10310 [Geomonas sp. RF6]|uniref:hypothetical protein n=1 Tax=Geomonas sp. RF6 TaxID=2897342 RepID=UPI001E3813C6|nr:hypothetical protein [Geomonas sp. RF6]UFS72567.1 hypothetical protein LPW11_10310 [Geomonas sp. RF6]